MIRILILILLTNLILSNCSNKEQVKVSESGFSILEYDSSITETLTLDHSSIFIDVPREVNYWSQFLQNPKNHLNNIYSESKFLDKEKILNGKSGPLNIIQPIYFDRKICHVTNDGFVLCIDVISDKTIFKTDIKPQGKKKYEIIRGGLAYFDNKVIYVDAYGQVKLINVLDGSIIWEKNIELPILSPPLIYRDYIYFISSDNRIFAISLNNGNVEWSFQTIAENKKSLMTASLSTFENIVIAPFSNGEIVAFSYDEGRPLWSENISRVSLLTNFDIRDIAASPVVVSNEVFTISTKGKLVSSNAINGKRNWSIDISGYRTPTISGGQIYLINDEGKLICVDKSTGEIFWITDLEKYRSGKNIENLNLWLGPYLINNVLYNLSYFGELKMVSPINGEILSSKKLSISEVTVPPIILKDAIYIVDGNANVFEFK